MGLIKSAGASFVGGLNLGTGAFGRGLKYVGSGIGSSIGLGITGAAIGAGATSMFSDNTVDPVTGAAVGGAIGAFGIPLAGAAIGAIGTAGSAAVKGVGSLGMMAEKGGVAIAPTMLGLGVGVTANLGTKVFSIGNRMVNWNEAAGSVGEIKFTGPISGARAGWHKNGSFSEGVRGNSISIKHPIRSIENIGKTIKNFEAKDFPKLLKKSGSAISGALVNGKTIMGAAAFVNGMKGAFDEFRRDRMGQIVGMQTSTPRIPSYSMNGGATGDLVFAMNANRRG